jgi:hypothetical protein
MRRSGARSFAEVASAGLGVKLSGRTQVMRLLFLMLEPKRANSVAGVTACIRILYLH